jgi:amino acid transporter
MGYLDSILPRYVNCLSWMNAKRIVLIMFSSGVDGADHIAEEIENAASVIPLSIWFSTLMNGALGFGMLLAVLFATPDFAAASSSITGFPFMDVFTSALGLDTAAGLVRSHCLDSFASRAL